RHPLRINDNPFMTLLEDQQRTRTVAALLRFAAIWHAQRGEAARAMRCCRAAVNVARSLGDEPFLISQMIRAAGLHTAGGALQRVLALTEPAEEDLALLQRMFAAEERHQGFRLGWRGERGAVYVVLTRLGDGRTTLDESTF